MGKTKKIVVIEDSMILGKMIKIRLEMEFDCEVTYFENPDNVLEKIEGIGPDIITLDYNFNGNEVVVNNGLDFLVEFRKRSKVPVVVFSGQRDSAKAAELVESGANAYIDKDKDDFFDELMLTLKTILEGKKA